MRKKEQEPFKNPRSRANPFAWLVEDDAVDYEFVIDELQYTYDVQNPNLLLKVFDYSNSPQGFKDDGDGISDHENDYKYDTFGNLIKDDNKNIESITYNHLNLPVQIIFHNGNISYLYTATGQKIKKVVSSRETITTDYLGSFQYFNNNLKHIPHAEGYVNVVNGKFKHVFNFTDHLGNIRLSYSDANRDNLITHDEILEENNFYPFGLKHTAYNTNERQYINNDQINELILILFPRFTGDGRYNYKYNGKEFQDELGLNVYDYGARVYDPAAPRFWQMDPMADEREWLSPYNYVQNNPLLRVDPTGMLDTHYEDEFGNTLADTNDGNNATVVISSQNADAFKKDFENTSVMFKDGSTKNAEWISKYGEGMIAEEGAKVQPWAVKAMGHDASYEGLALSSVALGMSVGEKVVKGPTFRLFNNKGANFSPKLYTSGWLGGSAGKIKTYGVAKTGLSVLGKFIGAYNAYSVNEQYKSDQISKGRMQIEQASNLFSTFGGIYGASWGIGWELGKLYGPSKWYGNNDTKWFE